MTYLEWLERVFRPDKSIWKGEDEMKVWTARAANLIRSGQECVVIKSDDGKIWVSSVNNKTQTPKDKKNVQENKDNR